MTDDNYVHHIFIPHRRKAIVLQMRGEEDEQKHSSTPAPGWFAYRQARVRTKVAAPSVDDPADLEKTSKEAQKFITNMRNSLYLVDRSRGPAKDSILVVIYTKNWWEEINLKCAVSGTPSDPETSLPRSKSKQLQRRERLLPSPL